MILTRQQLAERLQKSGYERLETSMVPDNCEAYHHPLCESVYVIGQSGLVGWSHENGSSDPLWGAICSLKGREHNFYRQHIPGFDPERYIAKRQQRMLESIRDQVARIVQGNGTHGE